MFNHYPVALCLQNKHCLVVGGGEVACRKIRSLLQCQARVTVVSPEFSPEVTALISAGKVNCHQWEFSRKDLVGMFLVIAATDDREMNRHISHCAEEQNILVNIVDEPEECNFIVPAVHRVGELTIAITTGGASPALAVKIKQELAQQYHSGYAIALDFFKKVREFIRENLADKKRRRERLLELASLETAELLYKGMIYTALQQIGDLLQDLPGSQELLQELGQTYGKWLEAGESSEGIENWQPGECAGTGANHLG